MSGVFLGFAAALLALVAAGLMALGTRRAATEQMLGVQLVGTGGIAILILLAVAQGDVAILDVALLLALLAAMAACAALAVVRQGRGQGRGAMANRPGGEAGR